MCTVAYASGNFPETTSWAIDGIEVPFQNGE